MPIYRYTLNKLSPSNTCPHYFNMHVDILTAYDQNKPATWHTAYSAGDSDLDCLFSYSERAVYRKLPRKTRDLFELPKTETRLVFYHVASDPIAVHYLNCCKCECINGYMPAILEYSL